METQSAKSLSWLWSDSGAKLHLVRGFWADARAPVEEQEAGEFQKPLSPSGVRQGASGVPEDMSAKSWPLSKAAQESLAQMRLCHTLVVTIFWTLDDKPATVSVS